MSAWQPTIPLTYGVARRLYVQRRHPRLLMDERDMATLRKAVQREPGRRILAALRRKAERLGKEVAAQKEDRGIVEGNGGWQSLSARLAFCAADMAMVAWLEERADLADLLARVTRLVIAHRSADTGWSRARLHLFHLAYPFDWLYGVWPADVRADYVRAALDRVRETVASLGDRFFLNAGANIPVTIMLDALRTLLTIRGESGLEAEEERLIADLVRRYEAAVHVTANAEGYPEEDIGYGTLMWSRLVEVGELLHRAGLFDVYRASPPFARGGRAILHFVQPWGGALSNTGDHGDDFRDREFALGRLAARQRDPSLIWLLRTLSYTHFSTGAKPPPIQEIEVPLPGGGQTPASFRSLLVVRELGHGRPPGRCRLPTAFCDPKRGIVSFRSGWDREAVLAVFDGSQRSPAAQGHAHASGGHVSLSALGEYFSIDTGRYANEQDQHSVCLVDGRPGRTMDGHWIATKWPGRLILCQPGPFVDLAGVDSSHQHNAYWAWRYLGLVKGRRPYVWVVDDINARDDWAEYHWLLQTSPENRIVIHGWRAEVIGWREGHRLDVMPILHSGALFPKPHQWEWIQDVAGSSAWRYLGVPEPMAERVQALQSRVALYARPSDLVHGPVYVRPRLVGRAAGYNGRFLVLLIPRQKEEPAPTVTPLPALPNVLAARIAWTDGMEDVVAVAYEHRLIQAEGMDERGQFLVRRKLPGGRQIRWVWG